MGADDHFDRLDERLDEVQVPPAVPLTIAEQTEAVRIAKERRERAVRLLVGDLEVQE